MERTAQALRKMARGTLAGQSAAATPVSARLAQQRKRPSLCPKLVGHIDMNGGNLGLSPDGTILAVQQVSASLPTAIRRYTYPDLVRLPGDIIAPAGYLSQLTGLTVDNNGDVYYATLEHLFEFFVDHPARIYRIPITSSGVGTMIFELVAGAPQIDGLVFNPVDGGLYSYVRFAAAGPPGLWRIDRAGAHAVVWVDPDPVVPVANGLAVTRDGAVWLSAPEISGSSPLLVRYSGGIVTTQVITPEVDGFAPLDRNRILVQQRPDPGDPSSRFQSILDAAGMLAPDPCSPPLLGAGFDLGDRIVYVGDNDQTAIYERRI